MRKSRLLGALVCSVCLVTGSAVPAMADSVKVVTLGADLTQEQKDTMMRYFKVDSNEVQILTITNEDEREHLSSYVPVEQIGTRTVSCAYVKPTQSGGIKVRTANLNWVTCNMIATTLSTSGVKNCEVVAACPFQVSGTGALTGIQMAYETASGEKLDETKKEIATQEMVVTGNLAEQVGQDDATVIVNQAKMQIIENNVQNADEIYNIVVNIAEQNNVQVSSEQLDKIVALLEEIAQQNYNYDDVKDTLEHVDMNVNGEGDDIIDEDGGEEDPDSIISDLDESILGNDVIAGSTEDPTLEEETTANAEQNGGSSETTEGQDEIIPEAETGADIIPEAEGDGTETIPEAEGDESGTEAAEETVGTDSLSEESKALYTKAETFAKGEYQGDAEALASAMGADAVSTVILDEETGKKLSDEVLKAYLQILSDGTDAYVPAEDDVYMQPELNMVKAELKKIFNVDGTETTEDDILLNVSAEDKQVLFQDTMKFFEQLYNETTTTYNGAEAGAENTEEAAE